MKNYKILFFNHYCSVYIYALWYSPIKGLDRKWIEEHPAGEDILIHTTFSKNMPLLRVPPSFLLIL